jgi:YggT family protein
MPNDLPSLIQFLFQLLTLAIIVRAVLSFFDPYFRTPLGRIVFDLTEPLIEPIRRIVPPLGVLDLSPLVAILLIQVLKILLNRALTS